MKRRLLALCALLFASHSRGHGVEGPQLLSPAKGAVVYAPHPHFRWQREADVRLDEVHDIQIARDQSFTELVCQDALEVVSRFVPARALVPGRYWWRVRRGADAWSHATDFEVASPVRTFSIRVGSDAQTVARVLLEAADGGPARVDFEPGEYALSPKAGESLVTLSSARDVMIDGHGAHLILGGTFLSLNDCQRVTVRDFQIRPQQPGHTLVRVVGKDREALSVTVKPEPGYPADVKRYFDFAGTGGSFLACMDPVYHGKYLLGGMISARTAQASPSERTPGAFELKPVKLETLGQIPPDALAVVTAYRWHWLKTTRTEECTFSGLTLSNLPGALCGGGGNDTAKSFLGCKVLKPSAGDYFGGHAHTGSGRIGEWIEACVFECLADDGPAQQSFRQAVKSIEGSEVVLQGGARARTGDRVALVNAKSGRGVSARVLAARGDRLQLDRPISELGVAIGQGATANWKNVFLYCDAQSNEDFVYRRNSHIGGRAHGVKFNGTRAWIADNHFENLNGNAVLAGYTSEVSGHGARDVVVSGNTIVRCGWTPIQAWSTSGLGGNIIVRGNRITETRETAIAIKGCEGVTISGNTFASAQPPKQGAWITAELATSVHVSDNEHPPEVPKLKVINARGH